MVVVMHGGSDHGGDGGSEHGGDGGSNGGTDERGDGGGDGGGDGCDRGDGGCDMIFPFIADSYMYSTIVHTFGFKDYVLTWFSSHVMRYMYFLGGCCTCIVLLCFLNCLHI